MWFLQYYCNYVILKYGVPTEVYTEQSSNFDARSVVKLAPFLSIRKTKLTPHHPQSNGQVERKNRTIIDYLSK